MKKKLGLLFVGLFLIGIMLIHTQWFGRILLDTVRERLVQEGAQLNADRFQLNLFRLSGNLKNIHIVTNELDIKIETVKINGAWRLMTKKLNFDSVFIENGYVHVKSPTETPKKTNNEALTLPAINLGKAEIRNIAFSYKEQSSQLDLSFKDFAFTYAKGQLESRLKTAPIPYANRELPSLSMHLKGKTNNFIDYSDLQLKLNAKKSTISLNGSIEDLLKPDLILNAAIGNDLLPETDLNLKGKLNQETLELEAQGSPLVDGQALGMTLKTKFNHQKSLTIPITIESDWGDLDLVLEETEQGYEGTIKAVAKLPLLIEKYNLPNLDNAKLTGTILVPGKRFKDLQVQAELNVRGETELDLTLKYAQEELHFSGPIRPQPGAQLVLSGSYSKTLTANLIGSLPNSDGLHQYQVPTEICSGPIWINSQIHYTGKQWFVNKLQLSAQDASYQPYYKEHLYLQANGPFSKIVGFLSNQNKNTPLVDFQLNLEDQHWDQLDVIMDQLKLEQNDHTLLGAVYAQGAGPLANPEFEGIAIAVLEKEGQLASSQLPFKLNKEGIQVSDLDLEGFFGRLKGRFEMSFESNPQWQAKLDWNTDAAPQYTAPFGFALPKLNISLEGDHHQLFAKLHLPEQRYEYEQTNFNIDAHKGLQLRASTQGKEASGYLPELNLSGLTLSNINLTLNQREWTANARFSLSDPNQLEETFCDWWPKELHLNETQGTIQIQDDLSFEKPQITVAIDQVNGQYQGQTFSAEDVVLSWLDQLYLEPFHLHYSGVHGTLSLANNDKAKLAYGKEAALGTQGFHLDWSLDDPSLLRDFFKESWPEDVALNKVNGSLTMYLSSSFEDPAFLFDLDQLEGNIKENAIRSEHLSGRYYNGLYLEKGTIDVAGTMLKIKPHQQGFDLETEFSTFDLETWAKGFAGNAIFQVDCGWRNTQEQPQLNLNLKQTSGVLVHVDPWFAITKAEIELTPTFDGLIQIKAAKGVVNGGDFNLEGHLGFGDQETLISAFLNRIRLDMYDYHGHVTSALEWRVNQNENLLSSTVFVHGAYYNPPMKIREIVESYVSAIPELHFPNPDLEKINLQATLLTESPIILENEVVYLELLTPSLVIKGNLAEPEVASGVININEGSTLDLGKKIFVFQDSQILFYQDRPGDPFLDLTMESSDYRDKQNISISNYLSDLGESLGENDIGDILASYLISNVISFVSLENVNTATLFESSAIAVASKRLNRKILARYTYPIFAPDDQKVEMILGPLSHNFISLNSQRGLFGSGLFHTRQFGFPEGTKPTRIRKVVMEPKDNWAQKKMRLGTDDFYSGTQARRAKLSLRRALKREGYLSPEIELHFKDGVLSVDLNRGPQTKLITTGLDLTQAQRREILEHLYNTDPPGLNDLARRLEQFAIERGHPSAAALVEFIDNDIHATILLGNPLPKIRLDFGEGSQLLDPFYKTKERQMAFIAKHFASDDSAKAEVRARLAAKGYLNPKVKKGDFVTQEKFIMPVTLGPRAKLIGVEENGKPIAHPFVGNYFNYEMIETISSDMVKSYKKEPLISTVPRKQGNDIVLEVNTTEVVDSSIQKLAVANTGTISEKKIKRFLNYKPGMLQSEFNRAHRRLTEQGPFRSARLQTVEDDTILTLVERNRWDVGVQLNWDEKNKLGSTLQIVDHRLFGGFNQGALNLNRSKANESILGKIQFQRIFGSPLDLSVGVDFQRDLEDSNPTFIEAMDDYGDYGDDSEEPMGVMRHELIDKAEWNVGISYPLTRYQTLNADLSLFRNHTVLEDIDIAGVEPTLFINLEDERTIAKLYWLYQRLDSKTDPKNGIFISLGVERYFDELKDTGDEDGESFSGKNRYRARLSGFKTWQRLLWIQRYEWGRYDASGLPGNDPQEGPFFTLGGANTVRGFDLNYLGPIDAQDLDPAGGEAMAFFSQELTIDIYQGFGLSPFVDGGWVWRDRRDSFKTPLVVTGGLGLVWSSPFGLLRIDWAAPIDDKSFISELNFIFEGDLERRTQAEGKALNQWSIRFGKVF